MLFLYADTVLTDFMHVRRKQRQNPKEPPKSGECQALQGVGRQLLQSQHLQQVQREREDMLLTWHSTWSWQKIQLQFMRGPIDVLERQSQLWSLSTETIFTFALIKVAKLALSVSCMQPRVEQQDELPWPAGEYTPAVPKSLEAWTYILRWGIGLSSV